ncbi:MAG TPA: hypothetical protein VEF04_11895 [Blastocatellia bacterium]|nr:hypothetical protein [Blastocatellia bacterium]
MIRCNLFPTAEHPEEGVIHINPLDVVAIKQERRRPYIGIEGDTDLLVIELRTSQKYVVRAYPGLLDHITMTANVEAHYRALSSLINHWREFGPEAGFDELIESYAHLVGK